jgi:hypothetical protein
VPAFLVDKLEQAESHRQLALVELLGAVLVVGNYNVSLVRLLIKYGKTMLVKIKVRVSNHLDK